MKRFYLNFVAALLALLAVPAVQAVPEQLTDAGHTADFPSLRADNNGNRHLVWYDADVDNGAILYRMFNANSEVLIDTTQINNGGTGSSNTRPSLVLDAASRVLVVWQNDADGEIYFLRIEPYLDDLDGSAADISVIKTVNDTRISDDQDGLSAVHPRSALDANGDVHIIWELCDQPLQNRQNVQYVKVDGDDGAIINNRVLLGGAGSCNDLPDIGLDSAGNAHVVFSNTGNTQAEEVYYAMIDGTSSSVLIDNTLLTVDDGLRATHATLGVDLDDDRLYVVYGKVTAAAPAGGEEIFMAALDPSLDDQDGSAANPADIRLFETPVGSGSPQFDWRAFSRFGFDRRIHVTYMDFDAATCQGTGTGGPYTIYHAHVTTAGRVLVQQTLTTSGVASAACDPAARLGQNGSRIVWADSVAGAHEIFLETFSRVDAGESGFTCSLSAPGSAWRAGDFWLLMAGLVALGVLRRRVSV